MSEFKPRSSSACSRSVNYHSFEVESSRLDSLCLVTAADADAPVKIERSKKIKPAPQSIELVLQLIEFIKTL
jgi:hypothetical protein